MTDDLFPKPKRRMLQPTKAVLRQRIADLEQSVVDERERTDYWKRVARYANEPGMNVWIAEHQGDGAPLMPVMPPSRAVAENQPPAEWPIVWQPPREPNPITSLLNRLFRRAA